MKKRRWTARLAGLLAGCILLAAGVAAAGTAGSEGDPLVTLSYLNGTFLTQLLGKVDEKLAARDKELSDRLDEQIRQGMEVSSGNSGAGAEASGADTFTVVTLLDGQLLHGDIGCEVMLRVGAASCAAPSSPGLIDETDGTVLDNGGALARNHLYMMTVEGRSVKAGAGTVKLLVRGGYIIS